MAEPASVALYEESRLSWEVVGTADLFSVELLGESLPDVGAKTVMPLEGRTYSLIAVRAGLRRQLGTVDVRVDDSACQSFFVSYELLELLIRLKITKQFQAAGLTMTEGPTIRMGPQGISVTAAGKRSGASAKLRAGWSYELRNSLVVPRIYENDLDISISWWARAISWVVQAITALAVSGTASSPEQKAAKAIEEGAQELADVLNNAVPATQSLRWVRVTDDRVAVSFCPWQIGPSIK